MMEEPSLLAGPRYKVTPHAPIYKREGNVVTLYRESYFIDRKGNEAMLTIVEYNDKKGKPHELVIRVKWLEGRMGITAEQLTRMGFELRPYPDGEFWVWERDEDYFLQVDSALTQFSVWDEGYVDELTEAEFYDTYAWLTRTVE